MVFATAVRKNVFMKHLVELLLLKSLNGEILINKYAKVMNIV